MIMVKHIVLFKMKENALDHTGIENAQVMKAHFERISKEIPGVVAVELGFNYNEEKDFYEMALYQTFESRQALADYTEHPLHVEVRDFVRQVIDHRMVVDYEL